MAPARRSASLHGMSKIALIAKLTAADGKADDLAAALTALTEAGGEEPGLEIYSVHADKAEPGVFYFFELYADQAALDVHGQGEAMQAAMGAVGSLLGGRPEIHHLTPVAAKGLDI